MTTLLNNQKHINHLFNSKNTQFFNKYLSKDATKYLKFIFQEYLLLNSTPNNNTNTIFIQTQYVQNITGLSTNRQKQSISILQQYNLFTFSYSKHPITNYRTKSVTINFEHIKSFLKNFFNYRTQLIEKVKLLRGI